MNTSPNRRILNQNFSIKGGHTHDNLFAVLIAGTLFLVSLRIVSANPSTCELVASGPVSSVSGPSKLTCTVDGEKREALVYAPKIGIKGEKLPLVFAFHGHGGNMENTASQMNFQTTWPDAVVIYPQGLKGRAAVTNDPQDMNKWAPGWQLWPGEYDDRDLKFFDRMLETMRQKFAVDDRRIYAAGFSNGAIFCYVLWAKRAQTLAAIGPVAACLSSNLPDPGPTELTKPLPVMHIAGLRDPKVLLEWQAETISIDRKVNDAPLQQGESCGDCCVLYQSSVQAPVKALFFTGGHEYPSWASAEFVKFFKAHKQP